MGKYWIWIAIVFLEWLAWVGQTVYASTSPEAQVASAGQHWQSVPSAWSFEVLWNMPGGIGALIGSFVGLVAVALSALFAFWLARRADKLRRIDEAKILATALSMELEILKDNLSTWVAKLPSLEEDQIARVISLSQLSEAPIYKANIGRIGILGASLTSEIVLVYGTLQFWKQFVETGDKKEIDRFIQNIKSKPEEAIRPIEQLVPRVAELAWRLEQFVKQDKDPGPVSVLPREIHHE